MPEGHTLHRIAREQNKLLGGQVIAVSSPQGRFAAGADVVDGTRLCRVEAYGKHLFYEWANGRVGHVHLGLFGRFRVSVGAEPPPPRGEVRMRMQAGGATVDLSGPTACSIGSPDDRAAIIARLGPDPLRRDARPDLAIARMARSRQPLGALLLDQSVLSGVGNVYRAEALFVAGIHPQRAGRDCSPAELQALWDTVATMLRRGVKDGRIVTIDRHELIARRRARTQSTGRPQRRGETTYVYHRDRCLRCTTPIETVQLAGRRCYFCPVCQPV